MYYEFEYQTDKYIINLEKISHIIKTVDENFNVYRLFINVGENSLVFSFGNKEKLDKIFDEIKNLLSKKIY